MAFLCKSRRPQPPKVHPESRQIALPDTWKCRWLQRHTTRVWAKHFYKQRHRPALKEVFKGKQPLKILISDGPKQTSCIVTKDSTIYSKNNVYAGLLWKIAKPTPWRKKSRWIRWPVYAARLVLCGIFGFVIHNPERVPISGRWRLRVLVTRLNSTENAADSQKIEKLRANFRPDDHTALDQKALDRLVAQTGFVNIDWKLNVVNAASMSGFPKAHTRAIR